MNEHCEHWARLSDRAALGEGLAPREVGFLHAHAASCEECGAEHATWQALSALLAQQPERRASSPADSQLGNARFKRRAFAYAAVACVATLVLGVLSHAGERAHDPGTAIAHAPVPAATVPSVARIARTNGAFEIDGTEAGAEARLQTGALVFARAGVTCLELQPAVRACLATGSLLRIAELGAARRVELLRGRVAAELQPQPRGSSFAVLTRDGSSLAVGTAFSVELPADSGPSVTRVLHGVVLVRGSSGGGVRVPAHYAASPSGALIALAERDEAREQVLLAGGEDAANAAVQHEPTSAAARAQVVAPPAAAAPSAAALLRLAREHAAAGDRERALDAYQSLLARHADSAEAHAASVPYGEMLLAHGNPARALAVFERYLARGGPLDQEASFGQVRALRALGRTEDERAALAEFLRRFPDSALAPSLRARTRSLAASQLFRPITPPPAPSSQNGTEAPR